MGGFYGTHCNRERYERDAFDYRYTADTVWTAGTVDCSLKNAPATHFARRVSVMKVLRFLAKISGCVAVCALLAGADSIQLRDGRHLQGKYIGGTTTAIGFMTGGTVEYFATSDVLVLIFDNTNDAPLSGLQPNPMKGKSSARRPGMARVRQINTSTRDHTEHPRQRTTDGSNRQVQLDAKLQEKFTEPAPNPGQR
jgi:hypothetical protein